MARASPCYGLVLWSGLSMVLATGIFQAHFPSAGSACKQSNEYVWWTIANKCTTLQQLITNCTCCSPISQVAFLPVTVAPRSSTGLGLIKGATLVTMVFASKDSFHCRPRTMGSCTCKVTLRSGWPCEGLCGGAEVRREGAWRNPSHLVPSWLSTRPKKTPWTSHSSFDSLVELCLVRRKKNSISCFWKNKDAKRTTMLIRTILYHLEHVEPFKNILNLFRTIWEHFEAFWNI